MGLVELAVWVALYAIYAAILASGDSNGIGYFQQPQGISLWAALTLGGSVNFWIMHMHAFRAMPALLQSGGRVRYLRWLALLLAAYLGAHLAYQIAIARFFEPSLRPVSAIDWAIENIYAAPAVFLASALYRFARDWVIHSSERETLAEHARRLEGELHLVQLELRGLQDAIGVEPVLRFESSREKLQTPVKAVRYIKAAGNYVEIVASDRTYTVYSSMKNVLEQLPRTGFARIHRSYIVNLEHITIIRGDRLELGDAELPVGASYRRALTSRWRKQKESGRAASREPD